jgi:hypothetical protein
MKPAPALAPALLLLGLLALVPLSHPAAQTPLDLSKVMVGTWSGLIHGGVRGMRPHRTLVIKTVRWQDGQWVIEADFGITGQALGRIDGVLEVVGDDVRLEFATPGGGTVRLMLVRSERAWVGTVWMRGAGSPSDVRLEKTE